MNRGLCTAIVLGITFIMPRMLVAERPANFGQQWVRSHPFTLNGLVELDTATPAVYKAAGYSSLLASYYPGLVDAYTAVGVPWHMNLGTSDLATAQPMANYAATHWSNGLGWYMKDEPNCDSPTSPDILGMGQVATWLKSQYPDMLVYTGLLGYSSSASDMAKVDNYVNGVRPDVLMYNWYPCERGKQYNMNGYFSRAMSYRAKGLQYNLPVFAWTEAFEVPGNNNYRYTSESEHRFQKYSYLSMGYRGLSDFIYSYYHFNAIVNNDGSPTPMYNIVASVNPEIQRLGNVLTHATSTAVRFVRGSASSTTPDGLTDWWQGSANDAHITGISVVGGSSQKNGVIGFFNDDRGEELFMLVNAYCGSSLSALDASVTFSITFDSSINSLLRLNQLTGQEDVVLLNNHVLYASLLGGTGNLYKYNNGVTFIPEPSAIMLMVSGFVLSLIFWNPIHFMRKWK